MCNYLVKLGYFSSQYMAADRKSVCFFYEVLVVSFFYIFLLTRLHMLYEWHHSIMYGFDKRITVSLVHF